MPNWPALLSPVKSGLTCVYTGTGRREELMCGRKGLQGGENRRPWKDRRTLHAFFHVEPDLPRVYVEKERARGQ